MRPVKYLFKKPDGKGGWIYTYKLLSLKSNAKFNSNEIFDAFDRVGFEERTGSFKEKTDRLEVNCKLTESKIAYRKDAEYCGIFNEYGDLIFVKKGIKEKVEFEDDEAKKIKNQKVMTHNHTEERSLSPEDIFFAIFLGIEEIRAVFENKTFSFKVAYKKKSKNYQELQVKNKKIIDEILNEAEIVKEKLQTFLDFNIISIEEAEKIEQREICKGILGNISLQKILNMEYIENEK